MNRGEVWLINLDPSVGSEITKTRPAVIVNDDSIGILPLRVIVPLTEWKQTFNKIPWMIKIVQDGTNGLDKDSSADTFQIRSVSNLRFVRKLGNLSEEQMNQLSRALSLVLNISA